MTASKRQAWAAFRRTLTGTSEKSHNAIGHGPSTSYSTFAFGRGVPALRAGLVCNARLPHTSRRATRLLRRETESFLRQWRGFKTAALGGGVGITQHSSPLLTALLPPALLWLLMVLPTSYRALVMRLWGLDAGGAKCRGPHGLQLDPSSDSPSSPLASAISWFLERIGLAAFVGMLMGEVLLAARAAYLCLLFLPAFLTSPLAGMFGPQGRERWLGLVQWTLENAGPAFIKWGQWASTRADLFPEDMCLRLEQLQTSAPSHSPAHTLAAVERAFGVPIAELFEEFDEQPIASGSIAQIHRACLSSRGAALVGNGATAGSAVAVKVRHPGVSDLMHRDFILMQRAAALASRLPGLAELRLEESIRQFGGPLQEQLDLAVEATHLSTFNDNFRAWGNVRFPVPLYPLVGSDVLVESFEEGDLISRYVRSPHRHNAILAQIGVDLFLKMMLRDNFIHADLHPGNIVVKPAEPPSPLVARAAAWLPARLASWLTDRQPQVVLLDTGMIVTLSEEDQGALLGFFRALTRMDGRRLAAEILKMSVDGTCKDSDAFAAELDSLFGNMDREYMRLQSQDVIRDLIERMRQHGVTLRSSVSTVVVTSLVLEGWSSRLDPDIRILDRMGDMLATDWADRVGVAVDKVVGAGALME